MAGGGGGGGTPLYSISGYASPKGRVFAPSQAENGYRLRPFLSNDDMISAYTRSVKVHGF